MPSSFWRLLFQSNVFALQCNQTDSLGGRNPIWGGWHKKLKTTRERLQQCVCTRSGQRNKVALNCSSFIQSRPHSFDSPLVVRTIAVYIISLLSLSQVEPTWLLLLVHLLFVFKVWPNKHQWTLKKKNWSRSESTFPEYFDTDFQIEFHLLSKLRNCSLRSSSFTSTFLMPYMSVTSIILDLVYDSYSFKESRNIVGL